MVGNSAKRPVFAFALRAVQPPQPSTPSQTGSFVSAEAPRAQVRLRGVTKRYGDVEAVHDLTLDVGGGEILVLLGPSGCGKTTVLRLIAGLEVPDVGEIEIAGRTVAGRRWVPPEVRGVGMVFQDYALFPHLNVADNVAFGLRRWSRAHRIRRVEEVLALVGLDRLAGRFPHELSGGEQQRVALARALAPGPQVLLLDEPLSNLDAELRAGMRAELRRVLKAAGTTAILVTHDQEEAFAIADRIGVLSRGRLWQVGSPEEIYHAPACRFVADFVGEAGFVQGYVADHRVVTELGDFHCLDLPQGMRVEVMLRPSDLRLHVADDGPGVVVSRYFRGSENAYDVRLPSGAVLRCRQTGVRPLPPGTRVRIEPVCEHPIVFPADGSPEIGR
ncbi:MAG: ABC transporter ATP-binding protein [Armatimonadota bacterium]|nr:ABC transporter ATP-binding protein [Armatimonadota bacterium]MDR5696981.1 ABC transporter ATP-binding protein [Armatimonadota bacterium]